MNDYGEPKTFTLDYGQMNVLFESLRNNILGFEQVE